ncbi:MAG: hypothetical protein Q9217_001544 [Psora testacea]
MSRNILHLPTNETYDKWAPTYDTDGNILQSLDSLALSTRLLPRLLYSLASLANTSHDHIQPLCITDLGCGTGRATLALIDALKDSSNAVTVSQLLACRDGASGRDVYISGLDSSRGMLNIARSRILSTTRIRIPRPRLASDSNEDTTFLVISIRAEFRIYDVHAPINLANSPAPADAITCALVIEHLASLHALFSHIVNANLVKPGGILIVTNMHPDMANGADPKACATQDTVEDRNGRPNTGAGFYDPNTNTKIRTNSYPHTIPYVLAAAKENGFELVENEQMEELGVEGWMLERGIVDQKRGEKWARGGVRCWFGGLFRYVQGA